MFIALKCEWIWENMHTGSSHIQLEIHKTRVFQVVNIYNPTVISNRFCKSPKLKYIRDRTLKETTKYFSGFFIVMLTTLNPEIII